MLFRILKKDLKRKKVMNAILLAFILLATMFVASGISNVVSVMNGTDSYLDKAGIVYFDLFSGAIQTYVFCMLTMTYVSQACGD